jgi:hypothetical protein
MQGEVRGSSEVQQDVVWSNAFLMSFFQGVCALGSAEHPQLLSSLAMCLGDYAAWFGRYQGHHPLCRRRLQSQPMHWATTFDAGRPVYFC